MNLDAFLRLGRENWRVIVTDFFTGITAPAIAKVHCWLLQFYRYDKAMIVSLKFCNGVFIQEEPVNFCIGDFMNNMLLLRRNLFVSPTILILLRELERTFSILHGKDDPSKTGRGTSIIENSR